MPLATTKIWPVKGRLDHLINYVLNPSKTEQQFFATGINCTPASAIAEMNATKQLFGKIGGTGAFHAYESFSPGEATLEIAHEIGTRLARELWGDSFQIVVTTHLDKGHIHNHIAINSVGFTDGLRFHSDAKLYRSMRQRSDKLCAEYGLSAIGNASAIRIPQPFCEQIGVGVGDAVLISVDSSKRIIIELPTEQYTLQARMRAWDGERFETHEYDWGESAGKEIW